MGKEVSKGLFKRAGILGIGLIVTKLLGALYKIPLGNILGAEGMGVYQMIYPVFALLITISAGALPPAVSILVGSKRAEGNCESVRDVIKYAMLATLPMAGVLTSFLICFASLIGAWQGVEGTFLGYIALAPAIPAVTASAVIKGGFQGRSDMKPTAISSIIEGGVKLAVGLTLALLLRDYGREICVAGALLGVTVSEYASLLILIIMHMKSLKGQVKSTISKEEKLEIIREVFKVAIPLTLGGMMLPLSQMADSFLIVNLLSENDTVAIATQGYGIYSGYVGALINLPVSLGITFGIAVLPDISVAKATRKIFDIKTGFAIAIKFAFGIIMPIAVIYALFGKGILNILYPQLQNAPLSEGITLMRICSVNILLLTLLQITTSVLQGVGYVGYPLAASILAIALKVALTILLVPRMGIYGSAVAGAGSYAVAIMLNSVWLLKILGNNKDMLKNIGLICLCGGIIGGVGALVVKLMGGGMRELLIFSLPLVLLYLLLLLLFGVYSKDELSELPFGKKLGVLADKFSLKGRLGNAKIRKT